jgi:diguanylate cyclase (GGDEF)-like protein/PAS domain S-box-containing protein
MDSGMLVALSVGTVAVASGLVWYSVQARKNKLPSVSASVKEPAQPLGVFPQAPCNGDTIKIVTPAEDERRADAAAQDEDTPATDATTDAALWGAMSPARKDGEHHAQMVVPADTVKNKAAERLALAVEATNVGIWEVNLMTNEIYFSDQWYQIIGYRPEELPTDSQSWELLYDADEWQKIQSTRDAYLNGETDEYFLEHKVRHKSGAWRWVLARGTIVDRTPDGAPLRMIGTVLDVTRQRDLENRLQETERRFMTAMEGTSDGIWDWDMQEGTSYFSPRWKSMLGYGDEEVSDHEEEWNKRVHPEDWQVVAEATRKHFEGESDLAEYVARVQHKDGSYRWILSRSKVIRDADGTPIRMIGSDADITRLKVAEEQVRASERRLSGILNAAPFPLLVFSKSDRTVLFMNEHAQKYLRIPDGEEKWAVDDIFNDSADLIRLETMVDAHDAIMGFAGAQSLKMTRLSDGEEAVSADIENLEDENTPDIVEPLAGVVRASGRVTEFEVRLKDWRDKTCWALISAVGMEFDGRQAIYMAFNDISRMKALEGELKRMATTDPLTEVNNRRHFIDLGEKELNRAARYERPLVVVQMDIDHFKRVNDTYGHHIGDDTIKAMARTCVENLRQSDIFGRLGGEEFAAILPETTAAQAKELSERVRLAVKNIEIPTDAGTPVKFTVSIGLTEFSGVGHVGLDLLLQKADEALYDAKRNGRDQVRIADLGQVLAESG